MKAFRFAIFLSFMSGIGILSEKMSINFFVTLGSVKIILEKYKTVQRKELATQKTSAKDFGYLS